MTFIAAWVGYLVLFEVAINVVTALGWVFGEQSTGVECTPESRLAFHIGMSLVGVLAYLVGSLGYWVSFSAGGTV